MTPRRKTFMSPVVVIIAAEGKTTEGNTGKVFIPERREIFSGIAGNQKITAVCSMDGIGPGLLGLTAADHGAIPETVYQMLHWLFFVY